MGKKWNALALGLMATVIFAAEKVQAQQPELFSNVPAEVHVIRDATVFSLFSNVLNAPTVACKFNRNIAIFNKGQTFLVFLGTVEPDGSLTVDRQSLLDALGAQGAIFVGFNTECGRNGGDYGAKGFLARIRSLEQLEIVTVTTLFFTPL